MTLRSGLYALAFLLTGAVLFILAGVSAIVFLADRHCGATFGYYGCQPPTASISNNGDQVARSQVGARLGPRTSCQRLRASRP